LLNQFLIKQLAYSCAPPVPIILTGYRDCIETNATRDYRFSHNASGVKSFSGSVSPFVHPHPEESRTRISTPGLSPGGFFCLLQGRRQYQGRGHGICHDNTPEPRKMAHFLVYMNG